MGLISFVFAMLCAIFRLITGQGISLHVFVFLCVGLFERNSLNYRSLVWNFSVAGKEEEVCGIELWSEIMNKYYHSCIYSGIVLSAWQQWSVIFLTCSVLQAWGDRGSQSWHISFGSVTPHPGAGVAAPKPTRRRKRKRRRRRPWQEPNTRSR